ncbi:MAG: hypothetical protein RLO50_10965 [Azospirillaceae bacterium]
MKRPIRSLVATAGWLVLAACQAGGAVNPAIGTTASSEVRFTPPACDYSVAFPSRPEVARANDSEQYIALLSQGTGAGRSVYYAECLAESGIGPNRAAQLLASLLRAEGVESANAADFSTEAGSGWTATGSTLIDGVAFRHEFVLVAGPQSALVLGISGATQTFPPEGRDDFLGSIARQGG